MAGKESTKEYTFSRKKEAMKWVTENMKVGGKFTKGK